MSTSWYDFHYIVWIDCVGKKRDDKKKFLGLLQHFDSPDNGMTYPSEEATVSQ